MKPKRRPVASLNPKDFRRHAVWQYASDDTPDETWVTPLEPRRVRSLANRVIGTEAQLANGTRLWAMLGSVDLRDTRKNMHFVGISLFTGDRWFHLARYHDFNRKTHGPKALAKALGLPLKAVFPIRYDISRHAMGAAGSIRGTIDVEPSERLSRDQYMALIFER